MTTWSTSTEPWPVTGTGSAAWLSCTQHRGEFLDHLRSVSSDRPRGARAADELLSGATAPSKQLMSVAVEEVRERQQFVLLDEQQVAYRMVLNAVEKAKRADRKEVVATGGPDTGRSVIVSNCSVSFIGKGCRPCTPPAPSRSPRR